MRVLIVGCGYVGSAVGRSLVKDGHDVIAVRRTPSAEIEVEPGSGRLTSLVADVTDADQLSRIGGAYDWVVNCAAAGGGGEADYKSVYVTGNRNLLEWLGRSGAQAKYVYTSSTSVYGQDDGSTVDEQSAAEPAAATGKILLEAEKMVLGKGRELGVPTIVLRLAGIYGPGRGYWFKQFVSGQAVIEGSGERVLNMVHREDAAGAIIAALAKGRAGEVYNVVDDEPVTQLAFFLWLADTLHKPLPPRASAFETVRKRGVTDKRVSNSKLKTELGYRFQFPTFRQGYADEINAAQRR
jgi:nucleoside-diphosphate-sugar epimerase